MSNEDRIRRRAHEIWEREGRPEGRHAEHWARARREIEAEGEAPPGRPAAAGTSAPGQSWGGTEGGAETEPATEGRDAAVGSGSADR
jgi:hypothetical protein